MSGRGWHTRSQFFIKGPGLALAPKIMCPPITAGGRDLPLAQSGLQKILVETLNNVGHLTRCPQPLNSVRQMVSSYIVQCLHNEFFKPILCKGGVRATSGVYPSKEKQSVFLHEPLPGAPRHVCTKFGAKRSRNWLRRTNIKSYLSPKIESTLKPSNSDAKPWFCALPLKRRNVYADLEG